MRAGASCGQLGTVFLALVCTYGALTVQHSLVCAPWAPLKAARCSDEQLRRCRLFPRPIHLMPLEKGRCMKGSAIDMDWGRLLGKQGVKNPALGLAWV
ncbi:hypothetical protein NDU88_002381 [Pleurodeles waltl]|uniref:Secreted protein n=1 Tax=Pleurodeles waltl TaxID=8319 RepID=A0AAV7VZ59_PLEWA|nr:hypothetical protein NDU88_002381 [Pleurodeles waltl]